MTESSNRWKSHHAKKHSPCARPGCNDMIWRCQCRKCGGSRTRSSLYQIWQSLARPVDHEDGPSSGAVHPGCWSILLRKQRLDEAAARRPVTGPAPAMPKDAPEIVTGRVFDLTDKGLEERARPEVEIPF